jgi:hypothetical protein
MTEEWSRFAVALTKALSSLPLQGVLIVGDGVNGQHFVQFAHHGERIRAEAAGGADEYGRVHLTERQRAGLVELGWRPPDEGHFNWWTQLDWPATSAQYRVLGEMSTRALSEAYQVASPATLEYQAWVDGSPQPLEFPLLGMARPARRQGRAGS